MPRSSRTPTTGISKKKRMAVNQTSTGEKMPATKMSRTQLINELSEIGILIPSGIKLDALRLIYNENVDEGLKKHQLSH
jgi:hypothetical protein